MRLMVTQVVARQFWGKCRTNRVGKPCSIQELGEFLSHNVQWTSAATPDERAERILADFERNATNRLFDGALVLASQEAFNPPVDVWRTGLENDAPYTWGNYTEATLRTTDSFGFSAQNVVAVNYTVGVTDRNSGLPCPWVLLTYDQRQRLGQSNCTTG